MMKIAYIIINNNANLPIFLTPSMKRLIKSLKLTLYATAKTITANIRIISILNKSQVPNALTIPISEVPKIYENIA